MSVLRLITQQQQQWSILKNKREWKWTRGREQVKEGKRTNFQRSFSTTEEEFQIKKPSSLGKENETLKRVEDDWYSLATGQKNLGGFSPIKSHKWIRQNENRLPYMRKVKKSNHQHLIQEEEEEEEEREGEEDKRESHLPSPSQS
eukprot:TRINITY_DN759_c0_g3_i2.p2 TRINITY_DN759_c0_g3~~TRINITY_DN759_c0_g3_i2.p2  ORF type:complete len:145 (-),score=65.74 TRINITY_DN759_c0_g3_i2:649-1083(-)